MIWIAIVGWILFITFFLLSLFFGKELLKKSGFLKQFNGEDGWFRTVALRYPGGKKGAMKRITLRGKYPFKVLVGFELEILNKPVGIDWFGVAQSITQDNRDQEVTILTWMGKKPVKFILMIKSSNRTQKVGVEMSLKDVPKDSSATVICPPHFYQKLGFYA